MDSFMRDSDAFTWYMERDPILRSTVVAVAWLDRSPDWDVLAGKVDRASRVIPSFRQRIIDPPARLATPRWTVDDHFDLSWHLRRADAPAPHTPQTVLEFARLASMTAFDRARPLWEFTLLESLEGGRSALVMKLHHSLTDGVGGMQLALNLFDLDADAKGIEQMPAPPASEHIGTAHLIRESVAHNVERMPHAPSAAHVLEMARHLPSQASAAIDAARSIVRTVAPVRTTLSTVMTERSIGRHLDMVEVDLADLKGAAGAGGGSLNDGFMAAVAGGLRRYHDRKGAPVEQLRVTLPISIRTPTDPVGGNRITLIRFAVPVADDDTAIRIAHMHRLCNAARHEKSLAYTNTIAGALNLFPSSVVGGMLKHVDFVASDVPGFTFPVYLGGARLERYVAFGPTIGTAVNTTLLSYDGTCFVGVNMDTAAVEDPDLLMMCLREGFDEVLDLAGPHAPAVLPLHELAGAVG
jgi:diacylglycerol O-acyltransferase / wax synthase